MNNKCLQCGGTIKMRIGSYKDKAIGLPHITLVGVKIATCKGCGEQEVEIPRIEELHRLIASKIVAKAGRLTGEEVRFLRKHIGWSGAALARHFGMSPETISRWENNKEQIGPVADRLLRIAVREKSPISSCALEDLLDAIRSDRSDPTPIRVKRVDQRWNAA